MPRGLTLRGTYYTSVTGIWQTVWLETVPSSYVESLQITTDLDARTIAVTAKRRWGRPHNDVRVVVQDGGKAVAEAIGRAGQSITLKLEDCKHWSPDQPHLYDLRSRAAMTR